MRAILLLLFLSPLAVFSQKYTTPQTTKSKALSAFNDGREHAGRGETAIALGYFERALREDPVFIDAKLALADAWAATGDHRKAESLFEEAIALDSLYAPVAFYFLAQSEWVLDKYAEAAAHCRSYLNNKPQNPKNKSGAKALLKNAEFAARAVLNPVPFDPQSLGDGVNGKYNEYFPSFTADGATLIFTRDDTDENFYKSAWKDGKWQKAEPLEGVNTHLNEGAQSISPDGSWLVFTACNREGDGSLGSCDLYWSQEKSTGWTKPVPFSKAINSEHWDSQPSISADGKTIIFSSRRPGGKGKEDLWSTSRVAGKWTKPVNLEGGMNTGGVEQTPFFHPDGQTLYFSSDSLPGMGGRDLYVVRRDTSGRWGEPVNLGYPINTKADEVALTVSLDGRTAYYASDRPGGKGGLDIYSFELPEAARPGAVTYVRAKVTDALTHEPLVAKVEFTDLAAGKSHVSANTKADGTFLVCLPAGKTYGLQVAKEKYFFHSEHFDLKGSATADKPFLLDIELQPIPDTNAVITARKPIVLRNIFFETGSAELRPESAVELDRLYNLLADNPTLRIQIDGHTDNVGSDADNLKLSDARAHSVTAYLVQKGVDQARLRARGFGETRPMDTNDNAEGRQNNRRTEFEVW